mmetsp:Transcript_91963/g.297510  ORF Transcript_91963/g.297510 Transcript_91963/m.297510 type:complete len:398 (+) Transcript_91963:899-2092(+)
MRFLARLSSFSAALALIKATGSSDSAFADRSTRMRRPQGGASPDLDCSRIRDHNAGCPGDGNRFPLRLSSDISGRPRSRHGRRSSAPRPSANRFCAADSELKLGDRKDPSGSRRPKLPRRASAERALFETLNLCNSSGNCGNASRPRPSKISSCVAPAVRSSTAKLSSAACDASCCSTPSHLDRKNFLSASTLPRSNSGRMLLSGLPMITSRLRGAQKPNSDGMADKLLFERSKVLSMGEPSLSKATGNSARPLSLAIIVDNLGKPRFPCSVSCTSLLEPTFSVSSASRPATRSTGPNSFLLKSKETSDAPQPRPPSAQNMSPTSRKQLPEAFNSRSTLHHCNARGNVGPMRLSDTSRRLSFWHPHGHSGSLASRLPATSNTSNEGSCTSSGGNSDK